MIPAQFDYIRAGSVSEAIAALVEHGDEAKLLAGGHSLIPLMKLRLATPAVLVDIGSLEELAYVRDQDGHLAIGAMTRHHDLQHDPVILAHAPLLATVAGHIGDPQVRHRGTIGGSLSHADPASDLPAAVLALDGNLVVQGPRGRREIAASEFFEGFLETALDPDEILIEVVVPKTEGGHSYQKFVRRAQDWAIVGVAVARVGGAAKVGLVNMGSTPLRALATESALASGASATEAAALAAEGLSPGEDLNATPEFRCHLARVLTRRGLVEAGLP
ncbi:MAG: FAD binding domain-containing protein [Acidimicrobiales bacterium]